MINPMHGFCVLFPVSQAHDRIQVVWAPHHEIYDDLKTPKKFNTFSITDERISPGTVCIGIKSQGKFRLLWGVFRPDMCQAPKKIRDPGSSGSMIWDIEGSWILYFYFTIEILGILNPDEPILSRDPRDLGSRTEKHVADPGDTGSCVSNLSWDLVDLGFFTVIMALHLEDHLHLISLGFWFPQISALFKLEHLWNLNYILIELVCVYLTNGSAKGKC